MVTEHAVEELFEKSGERFPTSMTALIKSFDDDLNRAKSVIRDAMTGKDSSSKNSLYHQLISTESISGSCRKNRVEGVIALLRTMVHQPEFSPFILPLLQVIPTTDTSDEGRGNSLLHLAARIGCCSEFESFVEKEVNVTNSDGETPLHLAAEFGHADDVGMLVRVGALLKGDDRGYTALHSAAMSSCCNPAVVSMLLSAAAERGEKFRFLNRQSNVDSGRNTALHVAAGNPSVTADFIGEFRDADPRLQNAELDTPFHVAAESSNPDAIVHMLTTFKFSNAGWEIDSVDANRGDKAPALVNICAGNGNAEAVALLIQQGADISQGTLNEIVVESTKKPDMTENFLSVYQTVVDNALSWRHTKEKTKSFLRGSPEYNSALRETMIYLTTKPSSDGKNVIQRCIELGASDLLSAILNTDNVYRFDQFGVQKNDRSDTKCSYSRYDVTDFARLSNDPGARPGIPESRALRTTGIDFTKKFRPKTTYLDELLMHFDEWRNTSLFMSQPLRKLTQPYFGFVQRYYFVIGLIQLLFMICFSANFIPDAHSLAKMFGPAVLSGSNVSTDAIAADDEDGNSTRVSSASGGSRSAPLFLWLIWPTIVFAGSIVDCLILSLWYTGISLFHSDDSATRKKNLTQLARKRSESWLMRMLLSSFHLFPLLAFCVSFLTWYDRYSNTRSRQAYLEATAMVFLFGWMTNFVLFSGITKELHVFLTVLKEIIIKDMILNFSLVFIFTVIAFSCTLHALRMVIVSHQDVLTRTTVYDIFMSALGVGDFIERVTEDSEDIKSSMGLLFAVYALYVCFTLIILMNILIAMLSNRYEDARQRAENVWRFETVKTAQIIEDFNVFRKFIHIDDLTFGYLGCLFRCQRQVYQDPDFPGREFVDVQLKLENPESD